MRTQGYIYTPSHDYLKYLRVIKYWVKRKYGINNSDLDMLLFLYSEKYFTKKKIEEFEEVMKWDKRRFNRMVDGGWISVFRKTDDRIANRYEISYAGRRMVKTMYKKLNREEEIAESRSQNPLFRTDASYMDKVYRRQIIEMNKSTRLLQHPAH